MGRIFKVEQSGIPLIPASDYPAVFEGLEDMKDSKYGPAIRLKFRITSGAQKDTVLSKIVNPKLTPKTNFGKTIAPLLKEELKVDSEVDLESLIGTPCVITVDTVAGSQGKFSTITEVKADEPKEPEVEPLPF